MGCSPLGSSVHRILQARTLEEVAIHFSRGSSTPRQWAQVSCIAGRFFTVWATREAQWKRMLPFIPVSFHKNPWVLQSTSTPDKKGAAMCQGAPKIAGPQSIAAVGEYPRQPTLLSGRFKVQKERERRVWLQVWEVKQFLPGLQGGQASSHWEMHVHMDYEVGQCLGNEAVTPIK